MPDNGDTAHGKRRRLATELRLLRDVNGITGRELARRIGISQSKMSRIEAGVALPSIAEVTAWTPASGVRPAHRLTPVTTSVSSGIFFTSSARARRNTRASSPNRVVDRVPGGVVDGVQGQAGAVEPGVAVGIAPSGNFPVPAAEHVRDEMGLGRVEPLRREGDDAFADGSVEVPHGGPAVAGRGGACGGARRIVAADGVATRRVAIRSVHDLVVVGRGLVVVPDGLLHLLASAGRAQVTGSTGGFEVAGGGGRRAA